MSEYDCHKCSTHHTTENMVCYCASCFAASEAARVKAEQERDQFKARACVPDRECKALAVLNDEIESLRAELALSVNELKRVQEQGMAWFLDSAEKDKALASEQTLRAEIDSLKAKMGMMLRTAPEAVSRVVVLEAELAAMREEVLEWLDTKKDKPYWEDYTKAQLIQLIEGAREALSATRKEA